MTIDLYCIEFSCNFNFIIMQARSLGSPTPETAQNHADLPQWISLAKLRQSIAAAATSFLAMTSAQAGPLTLENMPDAPVLFIWNGTLTTPGNFLLNNIQLRVAGDTSAEVFTTNWAVMFLDDGSFQIILNTLEDNVSTPSFSTQFDRYEADDENPWISLYYLGDTLIWNFRGGPGYSTMRIGNMETTGVWFAPYSPASNVPEPGTLPLIGIALAGAAWLARKKNGGEVKKDEAPVNVWNDEAAIA